MIVQACLNGARKPGFHPSLPVTPDELVREAVGAVAAGAAELHVHPRDAEGRESLAPAVIGGAVTALRARLPGTLIGVSTGAWIEGDPDRTLACIAGWSVLPDHASVNLAEPAAPAVIERLRRLGIGVEAGLATEADARRLVSLNLLPLTLRILVELDAQGVALAEREAAAILALLAGAGVSKPVLLHGFDATVWRFVDLAAERGFSTRVGLEDGAMMPDCVLAADNAALVAAALRRMRKGQASVPA
jgi:uncharacterized protein (DUF849 family)